MSPLEMRYDGVARRSQKKNKSLLDHIWSFLSSVKVAVWLIIITLIGAALGTLFPQESTFINVSRDWLADHYETEYGMIGKIYFLLGLSHTYESWWFISLIVLIGASLVVCSLDRVLPLYRALSKQQIRKHLSFILRQKIAYQGPILRGGPVQNEEEWIHKAAQYLRKKRYKVHTDGSALLAEKNRFSRWGPYINHIGLIILLLALLARMIPDWNKEDYIDIVDGDTKHIPGTHYYLKNEKFSIQYYKPEEMSESYKDKAVPKEFRTKAVLYECTERCSDTDERPVLKEVYRHDITVNNPLKYQGLLVYQYGYEETPQIISVRPQLINLETGEVYGKLDLNTRNPEVEYEVGPYRLTLRDYFPEFALDERGEPTTVSRTTPNAPAFVFLIHGPDLPEDGAIYIYFPREVDKIRFSQDAINGELGTKLKLEAESMDDVKIGAYTTYLNIRVDKALPYVLAGALICLLGLVLGFYWQHRRIWLRIDDGMLSLGAHTNKNWYGIRKEAASLLEHMGIEADSKQLDRTMNTEQQKE